MPRISIITSCYNAEPFIGQAIASAQAQDFTDWEMVVVDDGSADASAYVVQRYADRDARIRLVRQSNMGAPTAKNNGFTAAAPDSAYLWFLDADDRLKPGALSTLAAYLDAHQEVGMAGCEYDFINGAGALIQPGSHEYSAVWRYAPCGAGIRALTDAEPDTPFAALFCWCRILPSASLVRREIFARTPGYHPELPMGHDIDMALHCALHAPVHFITDVLVEYRRHTNQMTAQLEKIRDGEKRLEQVWLVGANLTPEQRETVLRAQEFKERRFRPHLWTQWGHGHRRDGDWRAALRCYAKSLKTRVTA